MKCMKNTANQILSSFYLSVVSLILIGLTGCGLDLSQFERDELNPMIYTINDLTQVDACTVYDPMFPNGNLYATIYNKERTVALMIMEESGGISGGQQWKDGEWATFPYQTPIFQVQLLMGRHLGQTPCSTLDQPEEIDEVFLPTPRHSMSKQTNHSFAYGVNAPECDGCSVEFNSTAELFWLESNQKNLAVIDSFSHYTTMSFTH